MSLPRVSYDMLLYASWSGVPHLGRAMKHSLAKKTTTSVQIFDAATLKAGPDEPDCGAARHVLAGALNIPRSAVSDNQLLSTLIEDSLMREIVIMRAEDYLGQEIDRAHFLRLQTVSDLAALMRNC
jgi:acyl carrier protein